MTLDLHTYARSLPKAELHLHLEGTLEPEMMLSLAQRNGITLPYPTIEAARDAYDFADLQSFLDLYYAGCAVLREEQDFYDLTFAYLTRAAAENIRHVEPFFDPQTHTTRGVPFAIVANGILRALDDGEREFGISYRLIMSILRDMPAESAASTLEEAEPFEGRLTGIGLDSAEVGHPPEDFVEVFAEARKRGYRVCAHAGEEGPASYITGALDALGAERIDHGVRCVEDPELVDRLVAEQIPLTVCPLSNVRLHVVPSMDRHPLHRLMRAGLLVTVNSDDPAYFGGYLTDNYVEATKALGLTPGELATLAEASFAGSFLDEETKIDHMEEVREFALSVR